MDMANHHRIRLRGHWQKTILEQGGCRLLRRFGQPRTLDPGEQAWLISEGLPSACKVSVNGVSVGEASTQGFQFDITQLLNVRNEVAMEFAIDAELDEVFVEFRPAES